MVPDCCFVLKRASSAEFTSKSGKLNVDGVGPSGYLVSFQIALPFGSLIWEARFEAAKWLGCRCGLSRRNGHKRINAASKGWGGGGR